MSIEAIVSRPLLQFARKPESPECHWPLSEKELTPTERRRVYKNRALARTILGAESYKKDCVYGATGDVAPVTGNSTTQRYKQVVLESDGAYSYVYCDYTAHGAELFSRLYNALQVRERTAPVSMAASSIAALIDSGQDRLNFEQATRTASDHVGNA